MLALVMGVNREKVPAYVRDITLLPISSLKDMTNAADWSIITSHKYSEIIKGATRVFIKRNMNAI